MKKKRFSRLLKSALAIAVTACLLITGVPVAFAAENAKPVSITFDDVDIIYNTDQYTAFAGSGSISPDYSVTFDDGYVFSGMYSGFHYPDSGSYYSLSYTFPEVNGPGSYTVTGELCRYGDPTGINAEFHVNVLESPVERIEAEPINILYHTNGHQTYDYDWETSQNVPYYYYYVYPRFTVYFKDGTSTEASNNYITYNGTEYYYSNNLYQSAGHELKIGSNKATANILGCEAEYTVNILESPVERIEAQPLDLIYHSEGYWSDRWDSDAGKYVDFYYYYLTPQVTVYFKDGTKKEDTAYVEYEGRGYNADVLYSQWNEGELSKGSHTLNASFLGYDFEYTVNIIDTPVKSVEFEPLNVYYHTGGSYGDATVDEAPVRYFRYDLEPKDYTVEYSDGTTAHSDSEGGVMYKNKQYYPTVNYDQNYNTELKPGSHKLPVSIMGYDTDFTVNVLDSPIERVEAEPLEFIKHQGGGWNSRWDYYAQEYVDYYEYDLRPNVTVYFKDGTVEENCKYVTVGGEDYYVEPQYSQEQNGELGLGSYTLTASFMGCDFEYTVNITDTPIESVEYEPVNIYYHTNGYFTSYTDDDGKESTYYYYYVEPKKYTVKFKNGETATSNYDGDIEYKGNYYSPNVDFDQENGVDLKPGSYTVPVKLLGYEGEMTVNILESPVDHVVFDDYSIIKNTNGYYNEYYDDSGKTLEYFRYDLEPSFTVYYKDGTSYKSEGYWFYYNGEEYRAKTVDNQSYHNQLKPGANKIDISILGYDTSYTVNIVESPVERIEFGEAKISQYTNGYRDTYYDDETEERIEYYCYDSDRFIPSCTVYFKDGSSVKGDGDKINYNGESYYMSTDLEQKGELPLGTYPVKVQVLGYETQFNVTIEESPYAKLEILEARSRTSFKYKVTKKDGTSFTGAYLGYPVMSNDNNIGTESKYDEETETTKYYATYAGLEAELVFPENKFSYIVQDGGVYITYANTNDENLVIPSEIEGKPVVGITDLGNYAKTVTVPDSVVSLSGDFLPYETETLNLGSGVSDLTAIENSGSMLKEINVSADNPYFTSKDGVVYNKAMDTVVAFPEGKTGTYNVPASVKDIDLLLKNRDRYSKVEINFPDSSKYYTTEDGVTYNKDKTRVISCEKSKTGAYTMPDTVKEIDQGAFKNVSLTEVSVSKSVTDIAYSAFENCAKLVKVQLPGSVKKIDSYAFYNCKKLSEVNMPESLDSVNYMAFCNDSLKELKLPSTLKYIGAYAFKGNSIESLVIPDSVVKMGSYAFNENESLKSITIGKGLREIPVCAFTYSAITSIVIPENIKYIGGSAFGECKNLKSVTVEGNGLRAGSDCFSGCALEDTSFIERFSSFEKFAFQASGIQKLKLGATVTELAYASFSYNPGLEEIEFPDSLTHVMKKSLNGTKWYDNQPNGIVYAGKNAYGYKGDTPENTALNIKSGTKGIAELAFYRNTNITSVTIPNTVEYIGGMAFAGCTGLKTVNIPASVTEMDPQVFMRCDNLTAINVDPKNPSFSSKDGVLFNKDKTILIYCPKRANNSYEIPLTVRRVRSFAFNKYIKTITAASMNTMPEKNSIGMEYALNGKPADPFDTSPFTEYNPVTVNCPKGSLMEQYAKNIYLDVNNISEAEIQAQADLSDNGVTDIADVTVLQSYIASFITLDKEKQAMADTNGDGTTDVNDVTTLQRMLAGFE